MSSSLTWLDYSDVDRRRAMEALSAFREPGSLDELGIGAIRDSFAGQLFPGTSTIQTRARYFLLVPWGCQAVEQGRGGSGDAARRARALEERLIEGLLEAEDHDGTIGQRAKRDLQQPASAVYWAGLKRWGIRGFSGSRESYWRWIDRGGNLPVDTMIEDGDPEAAADGVPVAWPLLPEMPEGFPDENVSMALTRGEAEYLVSRIRRTCGGTLLDHLVAVCEQPLDLDSPWDLCDLMPDLPESMRELLEHGELFSQAMLGAALLYNLLLAERTENSERISEYMDALQAWAAAMEERVEAFRAWDRIRFWDVAHQGETNVRQPAVDFCDGWIDIAIERPRGVGDDRHARTLVANREKSLKRGRSRLLNDRALQNWNGHAGTTALSYRWGIAQTLVNDIVAGLQRA